MPALTDVQRIILGSAMYIKIYFLNQCSTIKLTNSENRMKIMIVNSKTKQKSKTILGAIRNIVFDSIIYFVTAYILTESILYIHVT